MTSHNDLKPLVALYKVYRGGEWFKISLESIYQECVGAVVVMSDRPWNSSIEHLPENCSQPLGEFEAEHPDFKVIRRSCNSSCQRDQYVLGLFTILKEFGTGVSVLVIDSDEVWSSDNLISLRQSITSNPSIHKFHSHIIEHIKSPLYRVSPNPCTRPVVGLQSAEVIYHSGRFSGVRWDRSERGMTLPVSYCHFPLVRLSQDEVIHKIANTGSQDGPQRLNWMETVWPRLPRGRNLHPAIRFEHVWETVEVISIDDLPDTVRRSPMLLKLIELYGSSNSTHQMSSSNLNVIGATL